MKTLEQPVVTATPTFTLTRSSSVGDTQPVVCAASDKQLNARKSLRKTRSVSVFPTQSLEQMIGRLSAERYAQGKLTSLQVPISTVEQRSGCSLLTSQPKSPCLSPDDITPACARASPAPVRRKMASSSRRHTSLGISEDTVPSSHGGTGVLIVPGVQLTSTSPPQQSSPTPQLPQVSHLSDVPIPASATAAPTKCRRKDRQRYKSARDLSTAYQEEKDHNAGSRSSTLNAATTTTRQLSQTVTETAWMQAEP